METSDVDGDRVLVREVAAVTTVSVEGRYYRSVSQARLSAALQGSIAGGRWGPAGAFPVLYLADSYDAVVIEAHRHTTDTALDPAAPPRRLGLVTCDVSVSNVLALTTATARMDLGLEPAILYSEPQAANGAAYTACCRIAQAAHQLGRHGILVPSATQRGLTLALFTDLLPAGEHPTRVGAIGSWDDLPADPRRLRIIRAEGG